MHHQPQKLLDPHVVMFEYDRSQRTQAQPPAPLLETHDVAFSTPSLVGAPRVCMSSFGPFLPSLVTCCHHFLPSKVRRNYIDSKRRLIKSSPADPSEKKVPSTPNFLRCKAFRSKSAVANENVGRRPRVQSISRILRRDNKDRKDQNPKRSSGEKNM